MQSLGCLDNDCLQDALASLQSDEGVGKMKQVNRSGLIEEKQVVESGPSYS